jgi:hypothetical protein
VGCRVLAVPKSLLNEISFHLELPLALGDLFRGGFVLLVIGGHRTELLRLLSARQAD